MLAEQCNKLASSKVTDDPWKKTMPNPSLYSQSETRSTTSYIQQHEDTVHVKENASAPTAAWLDIHYSWLTPHHASRVNHYDERLFPSNATAPYLAHMPSTHSAPYPYASDFGAFYPSIVPPQPVSTPTTRRCPSKPSRPSRAQCDCPHCRVGYLTGSNPRKRNIHSCHVPGCGKEYNKTSHLKAHLRWHTGKQ